MQPWRRKALALVGAVCTSVPVAALAAGRAADAALDPAEVRAWLVRIHEAASRRNFQGTFIVSANGSVSSARIVHFTDGTNQYEHIESLDGQTRHVYRHNESVHTLWPRNKLATVERRDGLTTFPALLTHGDDHIADFYELRPQGVDRVAGHEADVLLVRPRDAHRFGYRLWADKASGLLLRADVLGERGEPLETSAFSEVEIGVKPQPDSVLRPMKKLDGYRVARPVMTPTKLEAEGWSLKLSVPGFRQVSCVRRPLPSGDGAPETPVQAVQAIYSDGLTYVSLFVEPFAADRHTKAGETVIGATRTLMQRAGDSWVTLVGDVPAATLRAFATGLERRR